MSNQGRIVHIVMTTWRGDTPAEALKELRSLIGRFTAEIPGVVSVVEGASVSTEALENGFEWAMVVTFEGAEARDGYLDHAAHAPVAALIGGWAERLVVFDLNA